MLKSLIDVWEYLPLIGSFFSDELPYTFSSPQQKGEHMDQGQKVHTPHVSLIPGGEGSDSRTDVVHVSFGFIKTFHRLWNLGVDTAPCSHTYSYLH